MNVPSSRGGPDGSDQSGRETESGESAQMSETAVGLTQHTTASSVSHHNVLGSSSIEHGGKGPLLGPNETSSSNGQRINGCHTTSSSSPPIGAAANSTVSFSSAPLQLAEGGSSCNASHSSEADVDPKKKPSGKKDRKTLRKGKWTVEEEEYTSRIIHFFSTGIITLPEGATLRSYLAERLNCDPMRITKKFAGASCLGRRVYHLCDSAPPTAADVERAKMELAQLERRFRLRVDHGQSGIPLPTPASMMMSDGTTATANNSTTISPSMNITSNNENNFFLHPNAAASIMSAAAANAGATANGASMWHSAMAAAAGAPASGNPSATFFFPPGQAGSQILPNAAAALGAWPNNPMQQQPPPQQQQPPPQQQQPLWLVPTPAPAPAALMPAPPAPAPAPIAATNGITNPAQQASDNIMAWAWNQAAATLSPLLQQLAVANLQQHQQQLKQAFENQVKTQLPPSFENPVIKPQLSPPPPSFEHQVKPQLPPPSFEQQVKAQMLPPSFEQHIKAQLSTPPPPPQMAVAAPLPPPPPAAAPPQPPPPPTPPPPQISQPPPFALQLSPQDQLKLAFEAHIRTLTQGDATRRAEQQHAAMQLNAVVPTQQTVKQQQPEPAPVQKVMETPMPMPPPLTTTATRTASHTIETQREVCKSPEVTTESTAADTPLTPHSRSKEDEAAGTMLLGFLSSLRKGYEDAVKSSSEHEETETLKRKAGESSEGAPPTQPVAATQEPNQTTRRMLISDHSLSASSKPASTSSRTVDQSNWQQLQTPSQLEAPNTQLSYLPMQMANGMRQMWPAPITDGSSSKATNDTNSSGESESSSDKGNPSSSEESDREPQFDRSLGPPRKRHKTKHAYGAFTRRNVKLHDSRSAAAAQLEDDNTNSAMVVAAASENPSGGNVREGPKKPPRM